MFWANLPLLLQSGRCWQITLPTCGSSLMATPSAAWSCCLPMHVRPPMLCLRVLVLLISNSFALLSHMLASVAQLLPACDLNAVVKPAA